MPCLCCECSRPLSTTGRPVERARKGWRGAQSGHTSQLPPLGPSQAHPPSLAARPVGGGGPRPPPCVGMPNTKGQRWQCQPPHLVPRLIREQKEGPVPPQGAGMRRRGSAGWQPLYPPDSTGHTEFAVGLGQLGLSWMYDIVIIIIIIILP